MNSSGNHRFLSAGKSLVLGTAALLVTLSAQAGTERIGAPVEQKSVVVRFADLTARIGSAAVAYVPFLSRDVHDLDALAEIGTAIFRG